MQTRRQTSRGVSGNCETHEPNEKHKIQHSPYLGNVKKKLRNETLRKKDELKFKPNGIQSSSTKYETNANAINHPDLIACFNAMKEVLTVKYVSVVERLKLTYPAKCTRSLKACSEKHFRNGVSYISNIFFLTIRLFVYLQVFFFFLI